MGGEGMEQVGKVKLDYTYYSGKDLYSDGAIESDLLRIAKNYDAAEYDSIIEKSGSWPIRYHFAKERENIVSFIPIQKTDKVLEVGSGCGAITGALARMAGSVDCVELSEKRSLINAYRNRDYDNINIHIGNFKDIEPHLPNDYDYICLIGVFEYAQSYMGSSKPYQKFMDILRHHVKSGGRILIAIENRLGMKYLAGCKEDHLGTYYSGIEGYHEGDCVRTFSKPALEHIILESGIAEYSFYYPYPDYKFPHTIYSDRRLPMVGELNDNMNNYDRSRIVSFSEDRAFDSVVDDKLFPIFSNSFLLVIGPALKVNYWEFPKDKAPGRLKPCFNARSAVDEQNRRVENESVQIYYDLGGGFTEENSGMTMVVNGVLSVPFTGDVKRLRIDPLQCSGIVYIKDMSINEKQVRNYDKFLTCNGVPVYSGGKSSVIKEALHKNDSAGVAYRFDTEDPNIVIDLSGITIKEMNHLTLVLEGYYLSDTYRSAPEEQEG